MRSRRPPPPPPAPAPAPPAHKNKRNNGRGADGADGGGAASNVPFVKVLVALIIIRAIPSSFLNGIHDCDETYNYWEPLMHITAGDDAEESANSRAMQTWEYAPENALRSYLFLWLAGWPAALLPPSRVAFHAVRLHLAFWASFAEAMLITACYRRFGRIVGSNAYFLFLISGGLFTSTTQLLPGTLTALGFTAATALAIERKPLGVIACVAVGSILGASFLCFGCDISYPTLEGSKQGSKEETVRSITEHWVLKPTRVDFHFDASALANLSTLFRFVPYPTSASTSHSFVWFRLHNDAPELTIQTHTRTHTQAGLSLCPLLCRWHFSC